MKMFLLLLCCSHMTYTWQFIAESHLALSEKKEPNFLGYPFEIVDRAEPHCQPTWLDDSPPQLCIIPVTGWATVGSTMTLIAFPVIVLAATTTTCSTVSGLQASNSSGESSDRVSSNKQQGSEIHIALYSVIFILSVVGNGLVIATCVQNKRMRTVTNVLLLNLAISDLLLSVFCMPFTLAGAILREFIFGSALCKLIPFLQAVSVSVGVWTLVTISLERYFAICKPLRSRRWQTLSHIYKMITAVWIASVVGMLPIAFMSQLLPIHNTGKSKCREVWLNVEQERIFTVFLDVVLLLIPLLIMALAYYLISKTLFKGMRQEMESRNNEINLTLMTTKRRSLHHLHPSSAAGDYCNGDCHDNNRRWPTTKPPMRRVIRRTNLDKSLAAKRRVIRMLFVVVLEFFVCWTPLYVVNTMALFEPKAIYNGLGHWGISLVHLLAYISSCCNPITYCFMHKKFRQGFLTVFGCRKRRHRSTFNRDQSGNESSFYLSRQSTLRTEIPCSEKGDEVYRQLRLLMTTTTPSDKSTL